MTVRTYAQNFEDVLLWRALRHVPEGRYVDVGAGHPELHSVTKLFYDAGWSGINIEPVPELAQALAKQRPRDITLHAAVAAGPGSTVELTLVNAWDELSTTDPARRKELEAEGRDVTSVVVPAVRLTDVVDAAGAGDLHFLKVDVEGGELDVLGTLDLSRIRPWIVVVEVVSADSTSKSRSDIREHLESHDYVFAYFDGLNDFLVAKERSADLLPSFAVPVNVRDDFTVGSEAAATVDRLGELTGMTPPVQPSELLQRVESLLRDRVEFETRYREADVAQRAAEVEADVAQRVAEVEADVAQRAAEVEAELLQGTRQRTEALEQALFERDRLIAWHAAEADNLRRGRDAVAQDRDLFAEHLAVSQAMRAGAEASNRALLHSTSWRASLPLRVLRRPRAYLRGLVRR